MPDEELKPNARASAIAASSSEVMPPPLDVKDAAILPIDAITGVPLEPVDACHIRDLRPGLADYLKRQYPAIRSDDCIDRRSIQDLRRQYITDLLREDKGELTNLEAEVAESIATRDTLAENTETEYDDTEGLGSRVADIVASFGGSWTFIIGFGSFLALWMAGNVVAGRQLAFDAYPFILLNLVLSTIAAFQAPVIMMSQRRQEAKDRLRANNDYKVNLKAELEIRRLHEKIDHLIARQLERLDDLQREGGKTSTKGTDAKRRRKVPRSIPKLMTERPVREHFPDPTDDPLL